MTEENANKNNTTPPRKWGFLLLFVSLSTLVCCALPIVLVTLGMGAVMASLATNVPFLVTISQYKGWTFSISAIILMIAAFSLYRSNRSCPSDPELGRLCNVAHKWNVRFLWVAITIWFIGAFAAFVLPIIIFQ